MQPINKTTGLTNKSVRSQNLKLKIVFQNAWKKNHTNLLANSIFIL